MFPPPAEMWKHPLSPCNLWFSVHSLRHPCDLVHHKWHAVTNLIILWAFLDPLAKNWTILSFTMNKADCFRLEEVGKEDVLGKVTIHSLANKNAERFSVVERCLSKRLPSSNNAVQTCHDSIQIAIVVSQETKDTFSPKKNKKNLFYGKMIMRKRMLVYHFSGNLNSPGN